MKNNRMKVLLENIVRDAVPDVVNLLPRISAQLERKSFVMKLRTKPLFFILIVLLTLALLSGVVYAISKATGYVPEIGLIDQSVPLRVLAEPVSITRDKITITVTSALLSADKTAIFIKVENVPSSAYPTSESDGGCLGKVDLKLANGTMLEGGFLYGGNWNIFEQKLEYASIPSEINDAIVLIACIGGTIEGMLPTNWEIPIRFMPAPDNLTVMPVIDLDPTLESNIDTETPLVDSQSLYGASLKIDKYIPLEDGYYLIGHTEWTDERVANIAPGGWGLKAHDSLGNEVPIDPAIYDDDLIRESLQPNQWAYKIYGKNFNSPITLSIDQLNVEYLTPILTTINLPLSELNFHSEYLGREWEIDVPINIFDISAKITNITYIQRGDLQGFGINIQTDENLRQIDFSFEEGLITEGLSGISVGSLGNYYDAETKKISSSILTNAPIKFPIILGTTTIGINGIWETTWNPPVDTTNSPFVFIEQACLDLSRWKEIESNQQSSFPTGLSGKILTMRSALSPEPSLFVSNLDGGNEQGLVFGHGSLSPDGTKLAYSDENGVFKIIDIETRNVYMPTVPDGSILDAVWSPDGRNIAFNVFADSRQIYVMDANGANVRQLVSENEMSFVLGWSGDSKQVLFYSIQRSHENTLKLIDIETNSVTDLWNIHGDSASISPNNQWIAYVDKVNGRMGSGIYISRLDGSEKKLIAQLDYWVVLRPIWSPDGNWLGFSVLNIDLSSSELSLGVINIHSCEAFSLQGINGYIKSWINP